MRNRQNNEDLHWVRDTHLHEDAHRYRSNGAGAIASRRTTALPMLRLTGFQSIRAEMRAKMHDISVLLAMAQRQQAPNPD